MFKCTHRSERCSGKLPSSVPKSRRISTETSLLQKSSFCLGYKLMRDIEQLSITPRHDGLSNKTTKNQRGKKKKHVWNCPSNIHACLLDALPLSPPLLSLNPLSQMDGRTDVTPPAVPLSLVCCRQTASVSPGLEVLRTTNTGWRQRRRSRGESEWVE